MVFLKKENKILWCQSLPNWIDWQYKVSNINKLATMIDDHTITTVNKVKGGKSTTLFRLDFDISYMVCASYQLLSVYNQSLTFIEKIISERQSPNTSGNN